MVSAKGAAAAAAVVFLSVADGARIAKRKHARRSYSTCGVKGASAPSGQIVNGQPATECEWRWQASLQDRGRPFCGGTLIAPDWVLTAAHCVQDKSRNSRLTVALGAFNTSTVSEHQQTRAAVEIISHPNYKTSPTRSDYAMVQLESAVELNECVGTACLPTEGGDVPANSKCWITGWGTLRAGGSSPEILQEGSVTTISNKDCVDNFAYEGWQIDESMLCAQGATADGKIVDACQGDSGGPLVCESGGKWSVHGATSWGRGCAGATYPGVWARVHEELDWIQDILSGNWAPPTQAPTDGPMCGLCKKDNTCSPAYCKPCSFCQGERPTEAPTPAPPVTCPGYCFTCFLAVCKERCAKCQ